LYNLNASSFSLFQVLARHAPVCGSRGVRRGAAAHSVSDCLVFCAEPPDFVTRGLLLASNPPSNWEAPAQFPGPLESDSLAHLSIRLVLQIAVRPDLVSACLTACTCISLECLSTCIPLFPGCAHTRNVLTFDLCVRTCCLFLLGVRMHVSGLQPAPQLRAQPALLEPLSEVRHSSRVASADRFSPDPHAFPGKYPEHTIRETDPWRKDESQALAGVLAPAPPATYMNYTQVDPRSSPRQHATGGGQGNDSVVMAGKSSQHHAEPGDRNRRAGAGSDASETMTTLAMPLRAEARRAHGEDLSLLALARNILTAVSMLMALVGLAAGVRCQVRACELVCARAGCASPGNENVMGERLSRALRHQVWEIGCDASWAFVPSCSTFQRVLLSSLRCTLLFCGGSLIRSDTFLSNLVDSANPLCVVRSCCYMFPAWGFSRRHGL